MLMCVFHCKAAFSRNAVTISFANFSERTLEPFYSDNAFNGVDAYEGEGKHGGASSRKYVYVY